MINRKILLCSVAMTACLWTAAAAATVQPLHGRFLQITDIHPDEHYLDGAAISSSCHTIVESGASSSFRRHPAGGAAGSHGQQRKGRYSLETQDNVDEAMDQEDESETMTMTLERMNEKRPGLASMSVLSSTTLDDGTTVPVGNGGFYGAPNTICDSPMALANATFDWIDQHLVNTIDFVVWTGDNARYVCW